MKCLLTCIFFCLFTQLLAQQSFIKTYDNPVNEWGWCVQQTSDKGYIIAGQTMGNSKKAFLLKTDVSGNELWKKVFGESSSQYYGYSVWQTSDNGFVLSGSVSKSGSNDTWIFIIKTNELGDTLWTKKFDHIRIGPRRFLINTEGDFVIGGNSASEYLSLIKTNNKGEIIWEKKQLSDQNFWCNSVIQTKEGGYLILGKIDEQITLIKTDQDGNFTWTNHYDQNVRNFPEMVIQTTDGYVVAGSAHNYLPTGGYQSDLLMYKTDLSGNLLWSKIYGGPDADYGHSIIETADKGFILAGDYQNVSGKADHDIYLVKTDAKGDSLWTRKIDVVYNDFGGHSIKETNDGGYVTTGYFRNSSNKENVFLLKTDKNGNVAKLPNSTISISNSFFISPNPANEFIEIQSEIKTPCAIEILNMNGNRVYYDTYKENLVKIDLTNLSKGIYIIKLIRSNHILTEKFIKN